MKYTQLEGSGTATAADVIASCMAADVHAVLVPDGALSPAFFDLSTGVAGDLVQKLVNYRIRMAVVVPDLAVHSTPFQEFAREANRGAHFRFFRDSAAAGAWLESGSS